MAKPIFWRVSWPAQRIRGQWQDAGFLDFPQRARANGFMLIRSAMGYVGLKREPHFKGQMQNPAPSFQFVESGK